MSADVWQAISSIVTAAIAVGGVVLVVWTLFGRHAWREVRNFFGRIEDVAQRVKEHAERLDRHEERLDNHDEQLVSRRVEIAELRGEMRGVLKERERMAAAAVTAAVELEKLAK